MGNSASGRSSLLSSSEKKNSRSNNCVIDRRRVLNVDPRSPSEGIVRTPIQLDKKENGWDTQDSKSVVHGAHQNFVVFPKSENVGDVCVIELNNFETLDGFLTEDDSIHRSDLVEEGASALSDTDLTSKTKSKDSFLTSNSLPRVRLSWMERLNRRKSTRDSPSLLVRMRHKHNFERRRTEQYHQHGGDGLPHDGEHEEKSQTEEAVHS